MQVKPLENQTVIGGQGTGEKLTLHLANEKKLLRTLIVGLYTKPLESAIRETLSNAFDATREAERHIRSQFGGETPGPLVKRPRVQLLKEENVLSIRDYGLGMSAKFLREKFVGLGNSTKDQSDDDIGGFGLGAKSVYAYGSFTIDSQTADERSILLCVIEGDNFTLERVEVPLDPERGTGTEVSLTLKSPADVEKARKLLTLLKAVNIEEFGLGMSFEVVGFEINAIDDIGKPGWTRRGEWEGRFGTVLIDEEARKSYHLPDGVVAISVWNTLGTKEGPTLLGFHSVGKRPDCAVCVGGIPYGVSSREALTHLDLLNRVLVIFHYKVGAWSFTPSREALMALPGTPSNMELRGLENPKLFEKLHEEVRDGLASISGQFVSEGLGDVFIKGIKDYTCEAERNLKGLVQKGIERLLLMAEEPLRTLLMIITIGPSRKSRMVYRSENDGKWLGAEAYEEDRTWKKVNLPRLVVTTCVSEGVVSFGMGTGHTSVTKRTSNRNLINGHEGIALYQPGLKEALAAFGKKERKWLNYRNFLGDLGTEFYKLWRKKGLKKVTSYTLRETDTPFEGHAEEIEFDVGWLPYRIDLPIATKKDVSMTGLPESVLREIVLRHTSEGVPEEERGDKSCEKPLGPNMKPSRELPGYEKRDVKTRSESYLVTEPRQHAPLKNRVTRVDSNIEEWLQRYQGVEQGLFGWTPVIPSEYSAAQSYLLSPLDSLGRRLEVSITSVMDTLHKTVELASRWENEIEFSDKFVAELRAGKIHKTPAVILLEQGKLLSPKDRCWTASSTEKVKEMFTPPITEMYNISVMVGEDGLPWFEANPQKRPSEYGLPYDDSLVEGEKPHFWSRALAGAANLHLRRIFHRSDMGLTRRPMFHLSEATKEALGVSFEEYIEERTSLERTCKDTGQVYVATHSEVFLEVMFLINAICKDIFAGGLGEGCDYPAVFKPLLHPNEETLSDVENMVDSLAFFQTFMPSPRMGFKKIEISHGSYLKSLKEIYRKRDTTTDGIFHVLRYPREFRPVHEGPMELDLQGVDDALERFRKRKYKSHYDKGLKVLRARREEAYFGPL